jgi:hypothetical protein
MASSLSASCRILASSVLGSAAEAVGRDGVAYRFDLFGGMAGQQAAGKLGACLGVVGLRTRNTAAGHVVEQRCGPDDLHVCAFGLGQALSQGQYAQDVVEIVGGIGPLIVAARLFDGDHSLGPPVSPVLFSAANESRKARSSASSGA